MKKKTITAITLSLLSLLGCSRSSPKEARYDGIVVGGIYASTNQNGSFSITKVLAVDESAVHVRIYKNKFSSLPKDIDTSQLSLGALGDPDGFGIGHAPMAREGWLHRQTFLKQESVRDEELEGYRLYLDQMKQ